MVIEKKTSVICYQLMEIMGVSDTIFVFFQYVNTDYELKKQDVAGLRTQRNIINIFKSI